MLSLLYRILDEVRYALVASLHGVSDFFEWLFQLDFSLRLMDGSLGFFHGVTDIYESFFQIIDGRLDRPVWLTILLLPVLIPYWLFCTIYEMLSSPISLASIEPERCRNLCMGIPSLLAMSLTLVVAIFSVSSSKSIDDRYRIAMKKALAGGDAKLAAILGGRLVSDRCKPDQETRFNYAVALRQLGDISRSDAVLTSLAPSNTRGYAQAHRLRAISFADELRKGSSKTILQQLRWHLDNCGDEPNEVVEVLRASYYVTIGQTEEAIPHMELAARMDHRYLISLANLYAQSNNLPGENRVLRDAEARFQERLKESPLSNDDRIQLAFVQSRLGKPELAEETVLRGVHLLNDAKMRRSAAEFYVLRFDITAKDNPSELALQFHYLEQALRQDPGYGVIYDRLVGFWDKSRSSDEAERVFQLLTSSLAEGNSPALAHFALSGIYHKQGDKDNEFFHLNQSYRLDANFPLIANNIAWMLVNAEQPDLLRAYELVKSALAVQPKDPRFRDTLATVLMKQGKTHEAIAEFEAILGALPDKIGVHRKLAELYESLDLRDMAKVHLEKAKDAANQLTTMRR